MSHCNVFLLFLSLDRKRILSLRFVEYNECYIIQITIVGRLIFFFLEVCTWFEVNIHNVYRRNFKGGEDKETINFSTTQWVFIVIIRVVHEWVIFIFFILDLSLDIKKNIIFKFCRVHWVFFNPKNNSLKKIYFH